MRLLLSYLLLALLLFGPAAPGAAAAASAPPASRPRLAPDTTAPPLDTARVLAEFFARQRRASRTLVLPAASAVVFFNYTLAYSKPETTFQQVGRGLNIGLVGYFGYRLGKALVELRRYRAAREQVVLAALARGEPLPARLRTRLAAYLRPTPAGP